MRGTLTLQPAWHLGRWANGTPRPEREKISARLRSEILENDWERRSGGYPVSWANASHHYAQEAFIPDGALILSQYYEVEIKIVDQQLALGGLRLAEVLNEIFKAPPS